MEEIPILITGGAGFIGSHTCKALNSSGYFPITIDDLSQGKKEFVKWGPFYEGDISDEKLLSEIIKNYNPKAVIHFAGVAHVGESVENPLKYYQLNFGKSLSLIQNLLSLGLNKIVFSSSCTVYGNSPKMPITENNEPFPINPYGKSKLMVENLLKDLHSSNGLSSITLRYFNAAGADLEGELGEHHRPEIRIIPLCFKAAVDPGFTLKVFGGDLPTQDGTCLRDYVHVADLAEAHVLSLNKLLKNESVFEVYNLGLNRPYSVLEIIQRVQFILGKKVKYEMVGPRVGDPIQLSANSDKAKNQLNWSPKFSDLNTMISSAWSWYQKKFST